ncbi:ABC transporter ATP-binding protein/permease [Cohnella ginsengisoli]|uniref:ABC transporter ATP-binding protein/permease n=1 Tax=Cohnella ginsengisoli TaxID=425004 RepID=A0A9X4QRL2_9BACL|nr:ABC transporter ATP-binding protein [Cohnella ginsengisoli]MDG0794990.1 ABC transporter ATP-binding protein/permease [Cohnella ginsengisoli]
MYAFIRRLLSSFLHYKLESAFLLAAVMVELAFETFMPLSFKFIIDYAIVPKRYEMLLTLLILMAGAAVASVAIGFYRDRIFAGLSARILSDDYKRLFNKLQTLGTDFFHRTPGGDIVSRFNGDLVSVDAFVKLIPYTLLSVLGLAANVTVLFFLQWKLALLAVIGMPLCLIGPKLFGKKAYEASYELKEAQAQLASAVQENIGAQPVIKAFGLQRTFVRRFADRMDGYRAASSRSSFLGFAIDRATNLGTMLLNLATIAVGSMLAYYGMLSIGSLLAFSTILISLGYLVAAVTWVAPMFIEAVSGTQRIQEILDEAPSVADDESAPPAAAPRARRRAARRHVRIRRQAAQPERRQPVHPQGQLRRLRRRQRLGESTIVNLLMRLYDPLQGAVLFDDCDIRTMNLQSVRSHIGIVFQESFLFHTSIMENIRLGAPEATDEEVVEAARAAEIHDFIMGLPDGYATNVGERGRPAVGRATAARRDRAGHRARPGYPHLGRGDLGARSRDGSGDQSDPPAHLREPDGHLRHAPPGFGRTCGLHLRSSPGTDRGAGHAPGAAATDRRTLQAILAEAIRVRAQRQRASRRRPCGPPQAVPSFFGTRRRAAAGDLPFFRHRVVRFGKNAHS